MLNGSAFNISVGEFSGSLEALLELVQKRKMHISNVSLAQVADDYIAYAHELGGTPSAETANFIVIAATLLLIKSKSLLPTLNLTEDEEGSIKDLEERLQLYSIYKQASDALSQHLKSHKTLYAPKQGLVVGAARGHRVAFIPTSRLNLDELSGAISEVLAQLPQKIKKPETAISNTIKIEDVMQSLLLRVQNSIQMNFNNMSSKNKADILINFLALLELVKDGVLLAEQSDTYGEIVLEKS